jgi:hypothetical protein
MKPFPKVPVLAGIALAAILSVALAQPPEIPPAPKPVPDMGTPPPPSIPPLPPSSPPTLGQVPGSSNEPIQETRRRPLRRLRQRIRSLIHLGGSS